MTTTLPLKTCPPRSVTLEEARSAGRAQISPYQPDAAQIQETLQWSRERIVEAEKDFEQQNYKRCWEQIEQMILQLVAFVYLQLGKA